MKNITIIWYHTQIECQMFRRTIFQGPGHILKELHIYAYSLERRI